MDGLLERCHGRFRSFFALRVFFHSACSHTRQDLFRDSDFLAHIFVLPDLEFDLLFLLLLISDRKLLKVLSLAIVDGCHMLTDRWSFRVPYWIHELAEFHRITSRAHTMTVRMLKPVFYQTNVTVKFGFEDESDLLGIFGHYFLQFL